MGRSRKRGRLCASNIYSREQRAAEPHSDADTVALTEPDAYPCALTEPDAFTESESFADAVQETPEWKMQKELRVSQLFSIECSICCGAPVAI
jgi:hypothetical protein